MQIHAPGTDTSFTTTALLLYCCSYLCTASFQWRRGNWVLGHHFREFQLVFIGKICLKSFERKGMFSFASYFTKHRMWLMSAFSVFPPFMWSRDEDTQRNSHRISKPCLLQCIIMEWWIKTLWLEYIWDGLYCPSTNFYNSCPSILEGCLFYTEA